MEINSLIDLNLLRITEFKSFKCKIAHSGYIHAERTGVLQEMPILLSPARLLRTAEA